jgi:hypothetical protein
VAALGSLIFSGDVSIEKLISALFLLKLYQLKSPA